MTRRRQIPTEPFGANIEKFSHDGRGIAYVDGKVTFIDGALKDEKVTAKYRYLKSQYAEAEITEVLDASPLRVTPKCKVFGICGGCQLQHMTSHEQLAHKQAVLQEQLTHFGNIMPQSWLPPLYSNPWGYRRKARLGVRYVAKKGSVLVGFREKGGRFITDMNACEVLHPSVGWRIKELRQLIDGLEAKTDIPQIEVAVDDTHTALVFRHLVALCEDDQAKLIEFARAENIWLYLQPKGYDSIHRLWPVEDEELSYELPNHQVRIFFHPADFTQVNSELNRDMVDLALNLLDVSDQDRVLDLFCGLGNFSLPLARYANYVLGVEGNQAMTERATINAKRNNIDNAEFVMANLFSDLLPVQMIGQKFDKALLDPPRAGAEEVLPWLDRLGIKRIVYVSCNPATLARDAGILVNKHGYTLESTGVMDMFPHTKHIESIALLTK